MTPQAQRLALAYWEGYRWLYLKREQDGSEQVQYVPANAIEQCVRISKEATPIPKEFTVCERVVRVLDGHPDSKLMGDGWRNAPNYPDSLHDCFRIQARLGRHERARFMDTLNSILNERNRSHPRGYGPEPFDYANASAVDRCQAILVALKLWPDGLYT